MEPLGLVHVNRVNVSVNTLIALNLNLVVYEVISASLFYSIGFGGKVLTIPETR